MKTPQIEQVDGLANRLGRMKPILKEIKRLELVHRVDLNNELIIIPIPKFFRKK